MAEASSAVRALFEAYVRATASADLEFFATAYGETFMFAGPATAQAVKRDDFLKVIPKRRSFFAAVGLTDTEVSSIDERALDEQHLLVRVGWTFRFERHPAPPIVEEGAATYVLRRQENRLQIVFQLDHQDLARRAQELGLLPRQG
jgi:Domain of unknown function (DUF4440)